MLNLLVLLSHALTFFILFCVMNLFFQALKDLSELIKLSISQAQNYQPLSGSTSFNRIEIPASSDPLNGIVLLFFWGFFPSKYKQ